MRVSRCTSIVCGRGARLLLPRRLQALRSLSARVGSDRVAAMRDSHLQAAHNCASAIDFSPSGNLLAFATSNGQGSVVKVWEMSAADGTPAADCETYPSKTSVLDALFFRDDLLLLGGVRRP